PFPSSSPLAVHPYGEDGIFFGAPPQGFPGSPWSNFGVEGTRMSSNLQRSIFSAALLLLLVAFGGVAYLKRGGSALPAVAERAGWGGATEVIPVQNPGIPGGPAADGPGAGADSG